jgi:hypothetical protein
MLVSWTRSSSWSASAITLTVHAPPAGVREGDAGVSGGRRVNPASRTVAPIR